MHPLSITPEQAKLDELTFPRLSDEEVAFVAKCGKREQFESATLLYEAGSRGVDFFVVLEGSLSVIDSSGDQERLIVTVETGGFVGEMNALAERASMVACRAEPGSSVIRLTVTDVRRLLVSAATVGEKWMEALLRRRERFLASDYEGLRVFGAHDDAGTLRLREFMHRNSILHHWIDTSQPPGAAALAAHEGEPFCLPLLAWAGEIIMQNPSLTELADRVGVHRSIPDEIFDTVIIGSGPAGLSAAVYAASEGLRTLVLDRMGPGGQAGSSSRIENFPGFPAGLSGNELAMRSYLQALKFGAVFSAPCDVSSLACTEEGLHKIDLADGAVVRTKTVIVASGVTYRTLGVTGLEDLRGAGVYYSATQVEALLCDHGPVHVIGAGNSAGQAAMFLSRFNADINLVVRGTDLRKSMSSYLSERVLANPRIHVRFHSELRAVEGTDSLKAVVIENSETAQRTSEASCAVFIFVGAAPRTEFLGPKFAKDEKGFVITGADLVVSGAWPDKLRSPCSLETCCPGVFAAGDCRSGTTKRVAFAIGDGSLAVTCVHDFLGTYS
jgi:thioredoxin reductase (NADPH)